MVNQEENKSIRIILRDYIFDYFLFNKHFSKAYIEEIIPRLEDWLLPTIIYDFYATKSINLEIFLRKYPLNDIFKKYPFLYSRVDQFLIESYHDFSSISRIAKTRQVKILGDIHPGHVTKYSDGKYVYYKSFPNYDPLIENLSSSAFPEIRQYFPSINFENGLFKRDYINVKKDGDEKSVSEYYFNFGYIMPLLLLLRTIDSNQENLLVELPFPRFFDSECMFLPDTGEFPYSIRSSGLIRVDNQDRSSLTGGLVRVKSILKPMVFGDMKCPKIKWIVNSKGDFDNLPKIDGLVVNPKEYSKYLLEGWNEGAEKVFKNISKIVEIVGNTNISFRVILKATKVYRYLILKSLYPQVYLSGTYKEDMRDELARFSNILNINPTGLKEYELKSMNSCLIPVFYSNLKRKEIYTAESGIVGENVESPFDIWLRYSKTFNKKFLDSQLSFLISSLDRHKMVGYIFRHGT